MEKDGLSSSLFVRLAKRNVSLSVLACVSEGYG